MAGSSIIIKDNNDTVLYTFGAGFEIGGYSFGKRTKTSLRAYQHGAKITADKKLNPRLLTISGVLYETEAGAKIITSAAFEDEWDELTEQINKETLHIYGYKIDRYIIAECLERSTHDWVAKNHAGRISLAFRCENPFWNGTTNDSTTQNVTANSTKNYINLGKESYYPIITWTANGNQSILKIKNQSSGNREWTYTGPLVNTDVVEVNCKLGTVTLNGTDAITNFSGPFFDMPTGTNVFEFTLTGTYGTSTCKVVGTPIWL